MHADVRTTSMTSQHAMLEQAKLTEADYTDADAAPGYAKALAAAVVGEKFIGSFCGSASAYCPTMVSLGTPIAKLEFD